MTTYYESNPASQAEARIVAFDVETPNWRNDRISSIGLAVIEHGKIVQTFSTLVNPETYFDQFNIMLTGITPEMTAAAPSFAVLWQTLGPMLEDSLLLAHNASFDLRVLSACLRAYRIPDAPRFVHYACTVQMGRRCYPALANHKLDTLCRHCGIDLDHHKADSDSLACASLFLDYCAHGLSPRAFLRTYDLQNACTLRR